MVGCSAHRDRCQLNRREASRVQEGNAEVNGFAMIRAYLMNHRADILMWTIVLGSFFVGVAASIYRTVLVYPDSRYYLAMAYLYGGESPDNAQQLTQNFMSGYGISVPETDDLFGWGMVQPRVFLPLLSMLPVRFVGPMGLAATVFAIHLAMTIVFTVLLSRRFGNAAAITTMVLISTSMYLVSFTNGMLTESFSALWTALTLMAAWWWLNSQRRWALVLIAVTVIGSAFTRQATFIVAGAFVAAWVFGSLLARKNNLWMWPAIVTGALSLIVQIFQSIAFPGFSQFEQFKRMTETDSLGEALLAVPRVVAMILKEDFASFLQDDIVLLVFILLAVGSMVIFFRSEESHLLFGAIAGVALYNVTNANSTDFRYAVPGLIFFAVSCALLFVRASERRQAESVESQIAGSPVSHSSV